MMDSLRYWVEEMHVDGFRFDIAPALGLGELIEVELWRGTGVQSRKVTILDHEFVPIGCIFYDFAPGSSFVSGQAHC